MRDARRKDQGMPCEITLKAASEARISGHRDQSGLAGEGECQGQAYFLYLKAQVSPLP